MIELPMGPAHARRDGRADDRRQHVEVPEGSTILDACAKLGIDTPTLCYGETLTPANACRICVVELEGARALAPACSRKAEPGMVVRTDTPRVRHSRKMVIEFLASSVDLSITPSAQDYLERYDAQSRALRTARAAGRRARPQARRPSRGARRSDRRDRERPGEGR